MKKIGTLLLCCCLAMACATAALADEAEKPEYNENGMPLIPDFTLPSNTGEDVSLSDFLGRQVVLYFWTTWCPSCVRGMPDKQALHDWMLETEFPGVLLAVNLIDGVRETRGSCNAFIERNGFTFPVLYEESGELSEFFGITTIPRTAVIDAEGYLKDYIIGGRSLAEAIAVLETE